MKKIWVHKAKSFKEAEEFDRRYYLEMSPSERLDIMQQLREMYFKFKSGRKGSRANIDRRMIKIIKVRKLKRAVRKK